MSFANAMGDFGRMVVACLAIQKPFAGRGFQVPIFRIEFWWRSHVCKQKIATKGKRKQTNAETLQALAAPHTRVVKSLRGDTPRDL